MSTSRERASTRRTATTAVTYVKKAVAMMERDARSEIEPLRDLTAYEAQQFLWTILFEIETLAKLIHLEEDDDYYADWIEEHARGIADRVRDRRKDGRRRALIAKLRDVEGRTPEEAAAFLAAAERLESGESGAVG